MLIVLTKSPWTREYGSMVEIATKAIESEETVAVLHIQDACIAPTLNEYCDKLAENKIDIYALKADCEARGLVEKVSKKAKLIDYKQWVELVMNEHNRIVSWTT